MSKLFKRMWRSPRLARVLLAVSAPALITVFFAPLWAIACSLIAAFGAAAFIYAEVLSPKFVQKNSKTKSKKQAPSASGDAIISDEVAPTLSAGAKAVTGPGKNPIGRAEPELGIETDFLPSRFGAHAMQSKEWSNYAWKALASSNSAQIEIRSVINISTHSALELANSIREIERNQDTQNHLAKSLLESTNTRNEQQASLSDLALLASTILKRQNSQLLDTAEDASSLIEKQQAAMMIAARADELLAEADKAARQLALNVMGSGTDLEAPVETNGQASKIIDPWTFVQNHRKTLKVLRADLDEIRAALSQVAVDMQSNVNSLRHTAHQESTEVADVSASIQQKLEETRSTVKALNELSKDTESHIQASIVAMQYHDIMTQKLTSVDALHLEAIAVRTRNLINGSNLHAAPEPLVVDLVEASHRLAQHGATAGQRSSFERDLSRIEREKTTSSLKTSNEIDLFA
jgi:hypothetical protein